MTLTDVLSLASLTTPFFCSLAAGWKAGRGSGILIGLIVGLVLSVGCFWSVRFIFKWAYRHPKYAAHIPGWLLFPALVVWIMGFACLGMWLSEFVIHDAAA
jgi:hypothetical protein